jgi:hypothetical protein
MYAATRHRFISNRFISHLRAPKPCRLFPRRLPVGLLALGLCLAGCGYGEVSLRGYDHAKALYSICNRRDAERLEQIAGMIEADTAGGTISEREGRWLTKIVSQARAGEWPAAAAAVRQLMEDQIADP